MGSPTGQAVQVAEGAITKDLPDDVVGNQLHDVDPREERAFVWRLDVFFLTIGFLGYMFKYIDQTNINNAYVSGMQEDLKLYGNELNYFTTFFNVGYIIMLWPSCVIVSHIGPSKWLPACELLWGIFTCCLSVAQTSHQVLLVLCYLALHKAPSRRHFTAQKGVQGVCTIAVALAAFFLLPGYPERPNPLAKFYLKPRHIEIALARAHRVSRKPQIGITVKDFFRCFTFWQLWAFGIAWPLAGNTVPSNYFNLWLKSLKNPDGTKTYSVALLNYIPIAGQAIQLVAEVLFSGASDYFRKRLPFLLLHSAINITSLVILIIRPDTRAIHFAGYFLNYVGAVSMIILMAWATENLQNEPQVRTMLFASGTVLAYVMSAFIPIAAFPAVEAPDWKIGSKLYLGFTIVATFIFFAIHYRLKWETGREAKKHFDHETVNVSDNNNEAQQVRHGEALVIPENRNL
ncbi:putative major facilitator superfamily transporter [Diaporthe ampelina]|uniref:Putative major facilitator superfamily transporter n=1 Tax=Diaporthe ampelina TaxID=1214573 RepID=A0A0G2FRY3_9PEZI|nr:putative major facilitator superfamily transporter [Diaporthe ampelina]